MKNWYEVVQPHRDIREGEFDTSVFAADLGDVAMGEAPLDYRDPHTFFKKTYLTDGLLGLLQDVHKKLRGEGGESVIEIQTPFGGGKTHSLLTLYHTLENRGTAQRFLPSTLELSDAQVAVIPGEHLDPLNGREVDGLKIQTIWGEIFYQLGGKEGYEAIREYDEAPMALGKKKLKELLKPYQPFLILMDETLHYVNRSGNVQLTEGTLRGMTLEFFQSLTTTIGSEGLERSCMVVTLPASALEDSSEGGENLQKLQKRFDRAETKRTPVKGTEVYDIIRRRLFEADIDEAARDEIVSEYFEMYRTLRNDLPAKASTDDYRSKMRIAYPFHPDVIDVLYEKWGTYPNFQRTRGVLQLLANVIMRLYEDETNIDMILPADIRLDIQPVRQTLLNHIGNEFESIIGSDISGDGAKAEELDKQNRGWKHLAERISTAIFIHSFTADTTDRGVDLPYIKLATLRPNEVHAMVAEVLNQLQRNLWYLNDRNDEVYYFSDLPNLNRMVIDKKQHYEDDYLDKLKGILKDNIGNHLRSYVWPSSSDEIPENKDLKLVVVDPWTDLSEIKPWVNKTGDGFRVNKNTLVFALPDSSRFPHLAENVKEYLALKEVLREVESGERGSLEKKKDEIVDRIEGLEKDWSYNIRRVYHRVLVGDDVVDFGEPTVGKESLSGWILKELKEGEHVAPRVHQRFIINQFLTNQDKISSKDLLNQFYKDTSLFMIEDPMVIEKAILQGVELGDIGLVYEDDGTLDPTTLRFKEDLSRGNVAWEEHEFIIIRSLAEELQQKPPSDEVEDEDGDDEDPDSGGISFGREDEDEDEEGDEEEDLPRYSRVKMRISNLSSSKLADINRGVILPISREVGEFQFVLEFHVEGVEGVPAKIVDEKIPEAIAQLGAELDVEANEE